MRHTCSMMGARDWAAGMAQQKFQQRIFLGAEINDASVTADAVRDAIDLEILEAKHRARDGCGGAAPRALWR